MVGFQEALLHPEAQGRTPPARCGREPRAPSRLDREGARGGRSGYGEKGMTTTVRGEGKRSGGKERTGVPAHREGVRLGTKLDLVKFLGHERDFQRSSRRDGSTCHGHWRILNQTCRTEPSVVAEGGEDLALELSGFFDLYLWRSRTQRPGKNTTEIVQLFNDRFGTLSCPELELKESQRSEGDDAGAPSCWSEARCPVLSAPWSPTKSLSVALMSSPSYL